MAARTRKAGHRSWSRRSLAGRRRGGRRDIMSADKRSALMARIRARDTGPERAVAAALLGRGLVFEQHARDLPGRPDIVFRKQHIAVFIDGNFWHGWRFPLWKHKLSPAWQKKIARNRERDQANFRQLRRMGWTVIRIWEHQVEQNAPSCVRRILRMLSGRRSTRKFRAV